MTSERCPFRSLSLVVVLVAGCNPTYQHDAGTMDEDAGTPAPNVCRLEGLRCGEHPDGGGSCGGCIGQDFCEAGQCVAPAGSEPHCTAGGWCWSYPATPAVLEASPAEENVPFAITDLWAISPTELWAVAGQPTDWTFSEYRTFVLHSNGQQWSQMTTPTLANAPYAIWGSDPDNVWLVGNGPLLAQWDGHSWKQLPGLSGGAAYSIWGTAADNVFVGAIGDLWRRQGTSWSVSSDPSLTGTIWSIAGLSGTEVWLTSTEGELARFDGTRLHAETPPPAGFSRYSTVAVADGSVWWFGDAGAVYRRKESGWVAYPTVPSAYVVTSIAAHRTGLHVASQDGVFRLDGDAWQREDSGLSFDPDHYSVLQHIRIRSAGGRLYVVGGVGVMGFGGIRGFILTKD